MLFILLAALAPSQANMDPFSISVGILTVLGTIQAGIKQAKGLRDAPREIDALGREIADLQAVVRLIEAVRSDAGAANRVGRRGLPPEGLAALSALLVRANCELAGIEALLQRCLRSKSPLERLIKGSSSEAVEKAQYRRFSWTREKKRAQGHQQSLQQITNHLTTVLNASIS